MASQNEYTISTDRALLDVDAVHAFLTSSYWSEGISRERLVEAIESSLPFGVYRGDEQVGFARAITDYVTFAYLADVYIEEDHRGHGLSKLLIHTMVEHPRLRGLRRWMLGTRDAHGLYAQYGFIPLADGPRWMERPNRNAYAQAARS